MKKIAILFPGQGSSTQELEELIAGNDTARRFTAEAYEYLGTDLPEQVRIVLGSVLHYECLVRKNNILPAIHFMAGHSLGEYSALICSGALSWKQGVKLLSHRQQIMDACARSAKGGMGIVRGLSVEKVDQILRELRREGYSLWISAYNTHEQITISGDMAALAALHIPVTTAGGKFASFPEVKGPYHCALMETAAGEFHQYLKVISFRQPDCAIYSSVTGKITRTEQMVSQLLRQFTQPVRWMQLINNLLQQHVDLFINAGPGYVLEAMLKKGWTGCRMVSLGDKRGMMQLVGQIAERAAEYVSPVTRSLALAAGTINNSAQPDMPQMLAAYNRIWDLQQVVAVEKRLFKQEEIAASLEDLRTILVCKGYRNSILEEHITQVIFETGLQCL